MKMFRIGILVNIFAMLGAAIFGTASAATSGEDLAVDYGVAPDVTYLVADGNELKLDIYGPKGNVWPGWGEKRVTPIVVFFHGGGWMGGTKDAITFQLIPYLEKGWSAVSVEYQLGGAALAPAAVEDARCAVWWVKRHADDYGFDPDRMVLTGESAGGHLALIAGMLPANADFDRRCPERVDSGDRIRAEARFPELKVAAIVNWAGPTDVEALIDGPNAKTYAVQWLGPLQEQARQELARRVSPITYVREGLPPILTIHGNVDEVVPYEQALRLHAELTQANVPNQLHTIEGGNHFLNWSDEQIRQAFDLIDEFLDEYVPEH